MEASEFENGYWYWDEKNSILAFNHYETRELSRTVLESLASLTVTTPVIFTAIHFADYISSVDQMLFRRYYSRKVKSADPNVVTIQDLKDIVLFSAKVADLTKEFIIFFHTPTVDQFLRAAIVYFQYYFQVWEHVVERREEAERKITQPIVTVLEDVIRDNLSDLRSVLAREYLRLSCGIEECFKSYHLKNKNTSSTTEKDRRLFEALMCTSVRVIWCALERKNFNLIETELNRLIRSSLFNLIEHRPKRIDTFDATSSERRYLDGASCRAETKLKQRSPAGQEILFGNQDYKLLALGIHDLPCSNKRQEFLKNVFTAPEEELLSLGVGCGLLGLPRSRFNAILKPRERTRKDVTGPALVIPKFYLPPREAIDPEAEMPKKPLHRTFKGYRETKQIEAVRNRHRRMWLKHIETGGNVADMFGHELKRAVSSSFRLSFTSSFTGSSK